jgi:hypothetical protein
MRESARRGKQIDEAHIRGKVKEPQLTLRAHGLFDGCCLRADLDIDKSRRRVVGLGARHECQNKREREEEGMHGVAVREAAEETSRPPRRDGTASQPVCAAEVGMIS